MEKVTVDGLGCLVVLGILLLLDAAMICYVIAARADAAVEFAKQGWTYAAVEQHAFSQNNVWCSDADGNVFQLKEESNE